jgi:hypothetical protein
MQWAFSCQGKADMPKQVDWLDHASNPNDSGGEMALLRTDQDNAALAKFQVGWVPD